MSNMNWTLSAVMLAAAFADRHRRQARSRSTTVAHSRWNLKRVSAGGFAAGHLHRFDLGRSEGNPYHGPKGGVSILAAGYEMKPETGNAKLVLVDADGMYALQSFESGAMGKEFRFNVVKKPAW